MTPIFKMFKTDLKKKTKTKQKQKTKTKTKQNKTKQNTKQNKTKQKTNKQTNKKETTNPTTPTQYWVFNILFLLGLNTDDRTASWLYGVYITLVCRGPGTLLHQRIC